MRRQRPGLRLLAAGASVAALAGCPKKPTTEPEAPFSWDDPPHLPSPTSGTYGAARGQPADPGLRIVLGSHPWDAALAGAAAGVGLAVARGEGGLTAPEVREAAWRAGWPYPIRSAELWVGPTGQPPPLQVAQWLTVEPDAVGLVRVRGPLEELWVGIASTVRVDVGALPRQLAVGAPLTLPAVPGARASIADPLGNVLTGELHVPWTATLEEPGEWLVEIVDDRGPVATLPIYVGMVPPDLDLLIPGPIPADPGDAAALALERLGEVRGAYGLGPCERDPILDAMVRTGGDAAALAPRAGFAPDRLWRWECRGSSVESCLDDLVWSTAARPGLLADGALCGVDAELGRDVRLRFVVGAP